MDAIFLDMDKIIPTNRDKRTLTIPEKCKKSSMEKFIINH